MNSKMPGLLKDTLTLFFERFLTSIDATEKDQKLQDLYTASDLFYHNNSIEIYLGFLDEGLFREISNQFMTFSEGDGRLLIDAVNVRAFFQTIQILLVNDYKKVLLK